MWSLFRTAIRSILTEILLPVPGPMRASLTGQIRDMLQYSIALPDMPFPNDIVKTVLTVTHGETVDIIENPANPHLILVGDDVDVNLALTYMDEKDNVSPASVLAFRSSDTIPPAAPGEMTVTLVGEVF